MTIDSFYNNFGYTEIDDSTEYFFEQENMGVDSIEFWYFNTNDAWVQLLPDIDFTWELEGEPRSEPIYKRARASLLQPLPTDATTPLLFLRRTPIDRGEDPVRSTFVPNTPFDGNSFEYQLDRITMIMQEIRGEKETCYNLPPTGPIPHECQPYSCSAFVDYMDTTGFITNVAYSTGAPMAWPFATALEDGGLQAFSNTTSSPSLNTAWGSQLDDYSRATVAGWGLSTPDFCGGAVLEIGQCNGDTANAPFGIFPPSINVWGDHGMAALVTGFNDTINMSGVMLRNTGKRWGYTRAGTSFAISDAGNITASLSTVGGDVILSLFITNTAFGYASLSSEVNVGPIGKDLSLLSASIGSGAPYERQNPVSGNYSVVIDVTVTASLAGQSLVLNGIVAAGGQNLGSPSPIVDLVPLVNLGTTQAEIFSTATVAFAYVASSVGAIDALQVQQLEIAYNRNFASYVPPGYCSAFNP